MENFQAYYHPKLITLQHLIVNPPGVIALSLFKKRVLVQKKIEFIPEDYFVQHINTI